MNGAEAEQFVRQIFNAWRGCQAVKQALRVGDKGTRHEFDIYQHNGIIGGISTSPWIVGNNSSNTGGRDRAAAELLWLTLWPGQENRVHVLTDRKMAEGIFNRFKGCPFPHAIEIIHCDIHSQRFEAIGKLGND